MQIGLGAQLTWATLARQTFFEDQDDPGIEQMITIYWLDI